MYPSCCQSRSKNRRSSSATGPRRLHHPYSLWMGNYLARRNSSPEKPKRLKSQTAIRPSSSFGTFQLGCIDRGVKGWAKSLIPAGLQFPTTFTLLSVATQNAPRQLAVGSGYVQG